MNKLCSQPISHTKKSRTIVTLCLEMLFMGVLTVGSVLIFLNLTREAPIDLPILQFLYQLRSPLLNTIMIGITNLGGVVMIGFGICVIFFLLLKKHQREALLFAFMSCMALAINTVLKIIIQRVRPQFYPLIIEKDYSFPSGHAMDSFVFYLTLSYIFFRITTNKKLSLLITLISLFLILFIGISRVYLGVHYPSDILGGYVGGLIWFLCVLAIKKALVVYRFFRKTIQK